MEAPDRQQGSGPLDPCNSSSAEDDDLSATTPAGRLARPPPHMLAGLVMVTARWQVLLELLLLLFRHVHVHCRLTFHQAFNFSGIHKKCLRQH